MKKTLLLAELKSALIFSLSIWRWHQTSQVEFCHSKIGVLTKYFDKSLPGLYEKANDNGKSKSHKQFFSIICWKIDFLNKYLIFIDAVNLFKNKYKIKKING